MTVKYIKKVQVNLTPPLANMIEKDRTNVCAEPSLELVGLLKQSLRKFSWCGIEGWFECPNRC